MHDHQTDVRSMQPVKGLGVPRISVVVDDQADH